MNESLNEKQLIPSPVDQRQNAGSSLRQVQLASTDVDLAAVEAAILGDFSVEACRVTVRETVQGTAELVAFVVPTGPFVPERLHDRLQSVLPESIRPSAYVPVSTLPLTVEGEFNEAALSRLPVIGTDLLQAWETAIQGWAEVDRAAVVAQDRLERPELCGA